MIFINIGYIIVGFFFLFVPSINMIDVLPDVFGYLLILKGLYKLSDLERNLLSARSYFKKAAWLSLGKLFSMLLIPIFDATWYLILSFSFGVMEMIWLIPAFVSLFEGIAYLELRYTDHKTKRRSEARFGGTFDKTEFANGTAYFELFEKGENRNADMETEIRFAQGTMRLCLADAGFSSRKEEKRAYLYESNEARVISVIFVIARAVLACLPEFTALAGGESGYVESNPVNDFEGLRQILAILTGVISLVFGLIWLVRMVRYFSRFRRDEEFLLVLKQKYETEILSDRELWIKRRTASFGKISAVAYLFLVCLKIDLMVGQTTLYSFFFVPEFVWGIFMMLAFRSAGEYAPNKRAVMTKSFLFCLFSLSAQILWTVYSIRLAGLSYPYHEPEFAVIFSAFMILFVMAMVMLILTVIEKCRVYLRMADVCTTLSCRMFGETHNRSREDARKELEIKIRRARNTEIVYAVFSVACMAVLPLAASSEFLGLAWSFRMLFGAFLIYRSATVSDVLKNELEKIIG